MRSLIIFVLVLSLAGEGAYEFGIGAPCGKIKNGKFKSCNPEKIWSPWKSSTSKKMGENLRKALVKPKYSYPPQTTPAASKKEKVRNNLSGETQ